MHNIINYFLNDQNGLTSLGLAVVILLTVFVLDRVYIVVMNILLKQSAKSKNIWDDFFIFALKSPIRVLAWYCVLIYLFAFTPDWLQSHFSVRFTVIAREAGIVVALVWACLRFISRAETYGLDHWSGSRRGQNLDKASIRAIAKFSRIIVIILGVIMILQVINIPLSGILAFGSIGGVAFAFASKDMVANFFGGLLIYFDRPFSVGDWIASPDKQIEGTVEKIGWRLTRIRTFDKRPLYVPNAIFPNIAVQNPSRMLNRRIKVIVGIRYCDVSRIESILTAMSVMLQEHPEIDQKQTLFVNLQDLGPSSLEILVYTFTKTTQWVKYQGIREDVLLRLLRIVEAHGGQCAFPTTTLDFSEERIDIQNSEIRHGE
ncbi:MscS family inner membrane protein YnaI [Piscirickettsia salmonis]|uniref:Mechanosensitive ion channel protein MscS n=1 Tax=Piscirickettsia salmonis TaxID=1238 RepID=A0AAC9EUT8_PISSA|nr:mechanosensitive ion channel family protein [Piscirickettsia salmonis]ALB22291.1 mechanosensitive ion channel protein MscS [Piscirickettsia salmonis]QGN99099.1 MscS family inner membrane protein YnaI [Piscirickettsia salmonis]QGO02727.1 MscS family inner membrane protein YnaI [Piscirickettsia salmonis]QGO13396.1 MscS family inner membrane protein YnaI [Piscirickettsia salmonis]QGO20468.1 MscS family inner membrane protein YnaI [Piscirickettsia salmonis]